MLQYIVHAQNFTAMNLEKFLDPLISELFGDATSQYDYNFAGRTCTIKTSQDIDVNEFHSKVLCAIEQKKTDPIDKLDFVYTHGLSLTKLEEQLRKMYPDNIIMIFGIETHKSLETWSSFRVDALYQTMLIHNLSEEELSWIKLTCNNTLT